MTRFDFVMVEFMLLFCMVVVILWMYLRLRADIWRVRPIERYARCSVAYRGVVVEPGIEWRDFDKIEQLWLKLEYVAGVVARRCEHMTRIDAAKSVEREIAAEWPGRAWFVEIHDMNMDRWTQTYQPMGIPRRR